MADFRIAKYSILSLTLNYSNTVLFSRTRYPGINNVSKTVPWFSP